MSEIETSRLRQQITDLIFFFEKETQYTVNVQWTGEYKILSFQIRNPLRDFEESMVYSARIFEGATIGELSEIIEELVNLKKDITSMRIPLKKTI